MPNLRADVLFMLKIMDTWSVPELVYSIGADWSEPGKMPCRSYSLPIRACNVGSTLIGVKGSACEHCYANRGRYNMPVVEDAMYRRLAAWEDNPVEWTAAQILLMQRRKIDRFRWFDAGDVQGDLMYEALMLIAEMCPQVKFWLPTKEYDVVRKYKGTIPPNMTVRVSHPYREKRTPSVDKLKGVVFSTIDMQEGFMCPATYTKKHTCSAHGCTACWDRSVPTVDYKEH